MAQKMAHVELVPARQDDRLLHVNSSLLGLLSPQQTERPRLAGTSLRPHKKKTCLYSYPGKNCQEDGRIISLQ